MKKIKKLPIYLTFLFLASFFLTSCAPKNETKVTLQLEALGAGPFFSGPNSLIAEYTVKLSDLKGLENVSKDQIKEIKIKSVSVSLNKEDDIKFDAFTSATLQIVGPNTDMQTVAIKNPIKSKNQEISLEVSDEVDIVDYFKGKKLSLVLDLNFIEDALIEEIGTVIEMELIVKHN
jgi:hypothetical protein|tara:strand:+ start:48867 stop:49394 length:528 start_codon:yes stop_codon:yes gene_type:complete